MSKAVVKNVDPFSIAEDCGIEKGDTILKVNNTEFKDVLDFRFLTSDEYYVIEVLKKDGTVEEIEVYNDLYEQFGCEFENSLMDDAMTCRNKCIFCFMDQLPPNMRQTMYFKDDDVRLSFLEGNYVTLTNISDAETDRLCRLRVSPINVSVHTTDPELRCKMLGNRFAGKLMHIMHRFADAGICMNTQIVLCKGINDGDNLRKTVYDLAMMYPAVRSISIVPVGITAYRDNLYPLESFDKEDCAEVINQVTRYQKEFLDKFKTRIVYLADEFYIKANMPLPPYEAYEDFPQIENGVGLMSTFIREVDEALEDARVSDLCRTVSIATSEIAYDYICTAIDKIRKKAPNTEVNIYKIANNYFGGKITVTGLLCGSDIISQLRGRQLGECLMISSSMLKDDCDILLDNVTTEDIERELNTKVIINHGGADFADAVLKRGEI